MLDAAHVEHAAQFSRPARVASSLRRPCGLADIATEDLP
jgi:hypothetical protein